MPKKMILTAVALTLFVSATAASAQPRPNKNWKSWFGHVDLSLALAEGEAGKVLDDGWSIGGGATYWPEEWKIGLVLDMDYTEFDVSSSTIRDINQAIIEGGGSGSLTGGDVSLWSLTVNGTWSPSDTGAGFYIIGGVGVYDVDARVTEDALVWYPPICDPWFWWCVPGGVGPGTAVRASTSSTEFGFNAGLGWAFEVGEGSQIYVEARFHSVDTSPEATEYLPLTVGVRW